MTRTTVDGNEAAVSVAYRLNEVCCIYPITRTRHAAACRAGTAVSVTAAWARAPRTR